jgi:prepilin-type N-terminal cleavage/methylation domain-containing protein
VQKLSMSEYKTANQSGFTLIELIVSLFLTLIILGVAVAAFSSALGSREREASKVDALASAQAALNVMSREIGNSGYGLTTNGIVLADSNATHLRVRSNVGNNDEQTGSSGEDITFFYDTDTQSVVRSDANSGFASGVINRVSHVEFDYFNYASDPATGLPVITETTTPTSTTARVNIKLTVELPNVQGQPSAQLVTLNSDITLRNATYMRNQY